MIAVGWFITLAILFVLVVNTAILYSEAEKIATKVSALCIAVILFIIYAALLYMTFGEGPLRY